MLHLVWSNHYDVWGSCNGLFLDTQLACTSWWFLQSSLGFNYDSLVLEIIYNFIFLRAFYVVWSRHLRGTRPEFQGMISCSDWRANSRIRPMVHVHLDSIKVKSAEFVYIIFWREGKSKWLVSFESDVKILTINLLDLIFEVILTQLFLPSKVLRWHSHSNLRLAPSSLRKLRNR